MGFLTLNQALAMSPVHMAIVMHPRGAQLVKLCENGGTKVILTKNDGNSVIIDITPEKHDDSNRRFTLQNINCRPVMDTQEAEMLEGKAVQTVKRERHNHCQIFLCLRCRMVSHLPTVEEKDDNIIRRISADHYEHSPTCLQPLNWMRIISCKSIAIEEDIPEWAIASIAQIIEEGAKITPERKMSHEI